MASGALKRFLPLFDRVLVQRAEAAAKSKGGIIIPEKAQAKVIMFSNLDSIFPSEKKLQWTPLNPAPLNTASHFN